MVMQTSSTFSAWVVLQRSILSVIPSKNHRVLLSLLSNMQEIFRFVAPASEQQQQLHALLVLKSNSNFPDKITFSLYLTDLLQFLFVWDVKVSGHGSWIALKTVKMPSKNSNLLLLLSVLLLTICCNQCNGIQILATQREPGCNPVPENALVILKVNLSLMTQLDLRAGGLHPTNRELHGLKWTFLGV